MLLEPEVSEAADHLAGVVVEVGEDDEQAAAADELGEVVERLGHVGLDPRADLDALELSEHQAQVGGGRARGDVVADLVVEAHQAHRVLLSDHQVAEAGGEVAGVLELRQAILVARVGHRAAHVEQDMSLEVRLLLILLDVEAIGAAEHLPVNILDVIAGHVLAVLGELDAEALERASVQSRDKPLDDRSRHQIHPSDLRQRLGLDIAIAFAFAWSSQALALLSGAF